MQVTNQTSSFVLSMQPSQAKDESEAKALQAYLRSRRVPDYKEGECDKVANLRKRLVARRRKREGKESIQQSTRGETKEEPSRPGNGRNTGRGAPKDVMSSDFSPNCRGNKDSSKDLYSHYRDSPMPESNESRMAWMTMKTFSSSNVNAASNVRKQSSKRRQ